MRVSTGSAPAGLRLLTVCATTVVVSTKTAEAYPFLGARTASSQVLPPSDVRKLILGAGPELLKSTVPWLASPNEAEANLQALPGWATRAEAAGVAAAGGARLGRRYTTPVTSVPSAATAIQPSARRLRSSPTSTASGYD